MLAFSPPLQGRRPQAERVALVGMDFLTTALQPTRPGLSLGGEGDKLARLARGRIRRPWAYKHRT